MNGREPNAEDLRRLAASHLATVRPGEVLVVRVPSSWTPLQVRHLDEALQCPAREYGIHILVVPGDQVTVTQPPTDPFGAPG